MKKMIGLLTALIFTTYYSYSQETLQTVTDRGNRTSAGVPLIATGTDGDTYTFIGGYGTPARGRIGAYKESTGAWMPLCLNEDGGNVGIGTTTPAFRLDVTGQGHASHGFDAGPFNAEGLRMTHDNGFIGGWNSAGTARTGFLQFNAGSNILLHAEHDNYLGFGTGVSERMRITPDGNIGIGTTNPEYKLDVNGSGRIGLIHFNNTVLAQGGYMSWNDDGGSGMTYFKNQRGDGAGGFAFQASTTSNERTDLMRISSNGNVGIGTTSPAYKLDVNGDIRMPDGNDFRGARFMTSDYSTMTFSSRAWADVQGANGKAFSFQTHNNAGYMGFEMMGIYYGENGKITMVPNGGSVGIGTENPGSYKLAVEGTIGARKIKVTQENWADYVFESSYQLTPLHEVEKFVHANKHLPDVPSAAEVKKEGLDLGDNQAVLLKKIEELTLYIIEQNKRMDSMDREIKELKSKR